MNDISIDQDDFDLVFAGGDFEVIESTEQALQFLTLANKGDFRESPLLGIGIVHYLNSKTTNVAALRREIQVNLELDNFQPTGIEINLPDIKILGEYANNNA